MNTIKIIILTVTGIVVVAIMLLVIQLLLRKVKLKSETDFKIKSSYGIWFASLFIAATVLTLKTVSYLSEAIDNIYKIASLNRTTEILKIISLYIGLSVIWFFLCYIVAKVFSAIIVGVKNEQEEMGLDNVHYFLIRGITTIGLTFSLSTILEIILRIFMPNIQIPLYH